MQRIARSTLSLLLLAAAATAAAGCGGGGGDADADVPDEEGGERDAAADDARAEAEDEAAGEPDAEEEAQGDVPAEAADAADADAAEERRDAPPATFDRFCGGDPWTSGLAPAVVGELSGEYMGFYRTFAAGTLETMKVTPEHPIRVRTIRVAFGGGRGSAKIRLMESFGHSYPDVGSPAGDLLPPITVDVPSNPDPGTWIDVDVSDAWVFLLPTEHYVIVYEHLGAAPYLAVEELPEGEPSRALIIVPGEATPYGVDGNYRMKLAGDSFCSWTGDERLFAPGGPLPSDDLASSRVAVSDLDGDGHDDLVLNAGGPRAFLGDGAGGFAAPGADPFPDAAKASMLVFADVDNDGDEDAFAAFYVSRDGDGDGALVPGADCNDADAAVKPSAAEIPANGKDDNCDGIVDDGADTSDRDADGVTVAGGDCDDTRADVRPGAPELLDARDNDCDRAVDEDFFHRILLNDGAGRFAALASSGVESIEPTAAAAFGDGDGDGNLDLYWGNWLVHYPSPIAVPDRYVTGNGDGTFVESTVAAGALPPAARGPQPCYGVLWCDYDNDGWQDIWVGNYGYGLNLLLRNDGDGTFTEVGDAAKVARDAIGGYGGNTFGGDFGDIDNDGDLDLYEANIAHPRYQPWSDPSLMLVNGGPPGWTFTERRAALGLHYDEGDVNAAFADFDNDMDLDLVVASLYTGHYSRLYRNDGAAGFTDVTYETGTAVHDAVSAAWSDVDEDGDLDLFIASRSGLPGLFLFLNRAAGTNAWVELALEGTETNRDAIGARATLTAAGVTQIREVKGGGGHSNTQSTLVVHFGLGAATAVTRLTVKWVGGDVETITGVSPGGRYRVVEGSGTGVLVP